MGNQLDHTAYSTAAENMAYDVKLLTKTSQDATTRIRVYTWKTPGITYPKQRPIAAPWTGFDHGERPTGGGIVFHVPGDIVWSIATPLTKGTTLTAFIERAVAWVETGLRLHGIQLHAITPAPQTDIRYCNTYESPFERYLGSEKVLGIALRRYRRTILLQGVIHLNPNQPYFDPNNHYQGLWTRGLDGRITADELSEKYTY